MTDHHLLEGRLILVVEDEFLLADDLSTNLQSMGAVVVGPAATVQNGISLIEATSNIGAAVLDINLRDTLVFPVADALEDRHIPFLFTSGYDRTIVPERHLNVSQVPKPYDLAEIAERLCAMLDAERGRPTG